MVLADKTPSLRERDIIKYRHFPSMNPILCQCYDTKTPLLHQFWAIDTPLFATIWHQMVLK